MNRTTLLAAVGVLLVVILIQAVTLWRAPPPPSDQTSTAESARVDSETVAERLSQFGPVGAIAFDERTGLFRASIGGQIVYATPDGQYLLAGEVFDLKTQENVTEAARAEKRVDTLAKLDPDSAITYAPEGKTRATVWVFTDVECAYCRKFHRQIADYNAQGIRVRYLAFPRSGPDSENWRLTQSVWCADDRQAALTQAKSDAGVATQACNSAPVARHYRAGQAVGLRGTPMVLTDDGRELGGYLSPTDLASQLGLEG